MAGRHLVSQSCYILYLSIFLLSSPTLSFLQNGGGGNIYPLLNHRSNDIQRSTVQNTNDICEEDIATNPSVTSKDATTKANSATNNNDEEDMPFFASWPKWLQNNIRDKGGVQMFVNTATRTIAAPIFYKTYPYCFPEFLRISGHEYAWLVSTLRFMGVISSNQPNINFSKEAYGPHEKQVAQVMISQKAQEAEMTNGKAAPLLLFLHGGAWGSGFATMYRLLSLPFLKRNYRVVILGYRTYPDATIEGQVDDLVQAVEVFTNKYRGVGGNSGPVTVMGHSSGAHVTMLAAMNGRLSSSSVNALIGASGVYDIEKQFQQEKKIGVHEMSPMSAANGASVENFRKYSPAQKIITKDFPPVLLIHGAQDDLTLPQNSQDFSHVLGEERCQCYTIDGVGHQDMIYEVALEGGKAQSVIFDWIESMV